ncbi:glucan 1, 4-alpha-glucosidase [Bombardia bombarda]|uniref:Glucoamylase n=1 Tax=Bombardia bombarda TaxID=252184 RepID=A0AA39XIM6_9PEZI|nr:glucan 1, 4-alpha-glucosidase [Bombardia bombarda]
MAAALNGSDLHPVTSSINSINSTTGLYQPVIMHVISSLLLLGAVASQAVFGRPDASGRHSEVVKRAVDSWIETEKPIALSKLLCNIGTTGCAASGAGLGVIVASPSKSSPDYWYTWTRDASLVSKLLVDTFVANYSSSLQTTIQNFIISQAKLQGVSNPSGGLSNGAGLAEPKFNVDLSQFTGAWGRPQRDGPPLRAITLINYAKWLVNNGYSSTASSIVWPIIKNDLAYTAQYWNNTGFDLWEEVNGSSFFTIMASHRALVEGAALASTLSTSCAACTTVAPQILCHLQSFWVSNGNYINSNQFISGRNGRDANSILGSIANFDPTVGCDSTTFQPCSERSLANHKAVTDSFRSIYAINNGIAQGVAVAVGRYSEDVYYNGNPWYLATLAAGEQLYDSLIVWKQQGSVTVTSVSLAFFKDLVPSIAVGTYASGSSTYTSILSAVQTYADGYVNIVATRAQSNGGMPEQFDRNSGSPLSAADLTWSYAAFLSAAARRAGSVPYSWNAASGKTLPSSCSGLQVAGSYTSATNTAFPTSQTPGTGIPPTATTTAPTTTATGCTPATEVIVTFNELATTSYGQTIKIVGNIAALGNWSPSGAVALSASGYTSSNPLWSVSIILPAGQTISYKYINVGSDGSVKWESDPNRSYTVPQTCDTTAVKSDKWQ